MQTNTPFRALSDEVYVAPQITTTDVKQIADQGFKTIICNRPDGESAEQTEFNTIKTAAAEYGIACHYLPVVSGQLTETDVTTMATLLTEIATPVLAYCRSGTRCTMLWSLDQALNCKQPIDAIIASAKQAGYDMSGLLSQFKS